MLHKLINPKAICDRENLVPIILFETRRPILTTTKAVLFVKFTDCKPKNPKQNRLGTQRQESLS